jgi:hypothetical protein
MSFMWPFFSATALRISGNPGFCRQFRPITSRPFSRTVVCSSQVIAHPASTLRPTQRRSVGDTSSIKLLRLKRRKDSEEIQGHLQTVALDLPTCPSFITLSYVWGTQTRDKFILVDGKRLPVTANLYSALEMLSASNEFTMDELFWVDSICINQADLNERASQVQLMGQIFGKSTRTIAWLGGDSVAVAEEAIDFIRELAHRQPGQHAAFDAQGFRGTPLDLQNVSKWRAIEAFLCMPWWNRMWTVQECVVARHIDYYFCGKKVSYGELAIALSCIWFCEPCDLLISETAWTAAWNRLRLWALYHTSGYSDNLGLVALMAYSGANSATDPRDRIYGLLGLASAACCEMVGRPTYEDDIEVIYTRLVQSFVKRFNSLDIICFSQIFRPSIPSAPDCPSIWDWPTWLPDWRTRIQPFVTPLMVSQTCSPIDNFRPGFATTPTVRHRYKADGLSGIEKAPTFQIDNKRLVCDGVFLDVIDGLGAILGQNSTCQLSQVIPATSNCNTAPSDIVSSKSSGQISQLLDDLVSSLVLNREDRYLSLPAPTSRYTVELLSLIRLPCAVYDRLPRRCKLAIQWYHANKNFLWRGQTLEKLCQDRISRDGIGSQYDFHSSREHSFASRLIDTTGDLTMKRRLLVSEKGTIGMAPWEARKGDLLFILIGCSVPVVLRRRSENSYSFVGEAYIHGFMDGEAVSKSRKRERVVLT